MFWVCFPPPSLNRAGDRLRRSYKQTTIGELSRALEKKLGSKSSLQNRNTKQTCCACAFVCVRVHACAYVCVCVCSVGELFMCVWCVMRVCVSKCVNNSVIVWSIDSLSRSFALSGLSNHCRTISDCSRYFAQFRTISRSLDSYSNYCLDCRVMGVLCLDRLVHTSTTSTRVILIPYLMKNQTLWFSYLLHIFSSKKFANRAKV